MKLLLIFPIVIIGVVALFYIAPPFTLGNCNGSKAVPWWPNSGCKCLGIIAVDKTKMGTMPAPGSYNYNICKGIIVH